MSEGLPQPPDRPEGVRTPLSSPVIGSRLCPVCGKWELQGERTACSPACRRERSRRRQQEGRQARDREVLALLDLAERLEERAAALRIQARGRLGGSP